MTFYLVETLHSLSVGILSFLVVSYPEILK